MNTDSKIRPIEEFEVHSGAIVLGGWFDPLTAETARTVENVALAHQESKILIAIFDGPEPLLPADARARVMAALRDVDFVTVLPHHRWADFLNECEKHEVIPSLDFVDLVLRKSALKAGT